jgi:hypothetical protein
MNHFDWSGISTRILNSDVEAGRHLILTAVAEAKEDDGILCFVGTFLVEPYVALHGAKAVEVLEAEVPSNTGLLRALSCADCSGIDERLEARIDAISPPFDSSDNIGRGRGPTTDRPDGAM